MQLLVRTISGSTSTVLAQPADTVHDLKLRLQASVACLAPFSSI
jgi:hypothetical protein